MIALNIDHAFVLEPADSLPPVSLSPTDFSLLTTRRSRSRVPYSPRGLFRSLVVSLQRFSHHVTSPLGEVAASAAGEGLYRLS